MDFRSLHQSFQLGLLLLSADDYIKRLLKDWDQKGKGEFLKGEFRLNLRNTGLNATSAEADALFDSWDDDKGGSLDLGELKRALQGVKQNLLDEYEGKMTELLQALHSVERAFVQQKEQYEAELQRQGIKK